jgi:hypothetical protein
MSNSISIKEIEGLKYREIFQKLTGVKLINGDNHNFSRIIVDVNTPVEGDYIWMVGCIISIHDVISDIENLTETVFMTSRKVEKENGTVNAYDILYFENEAIKHWGTIYSEEPQWQEKLYQVLCYLIYEREKGGKNE